MCIISVNINTRFSRIAKLKNVEWKHLDQGRGTFLALEAAYGPLGPQVQSFDWIQTS